MSSIFMVKSAEEAEKRIENLRNKKFERERKIFLHAPALYDLNFEDLNFLIKHYEKYFKKVMVQFQYDNFEYTLLFNKKNNEHQVYYLHLKLKPADKSKKNPPNSIKNISNYIKRKYSYKIHCNWNSGPTFSVNYTGKGEDIKFDVKPLIKKYHATIKLVKLKNPPESLFNFAADKLEKLR